MSLPKNSTQEFTEIKDIVDNIVIFTNSTAALPVEVAAINFSLLSQDEQDARVGAFASFVNSLSFPTQILAINKRVDISSYIKLLGDQIKILENPKVAGYMYQYRDFVQQLVTQNTVLDKRFYIVVNYSSLEGGTGKTGTTAGDFVLNAQNSLNTKADTIRGQLTRINLQTRTLNRDELIDLFADLYGHEENV